MFRGVQGSLGAFLDDGPVHHPQFAMLSDDIRRLCADVEAPSLDTRPGQAAFRALTDRLAAYFLTQEGRPRGERFAGTGFAAGDCNSEHAWKRHRLTGGRTAPSVAEVIRGFRRDLNVVMSRGVWRIFAVALAQYRRTLESRALLDFSGVLERAVRLLRDLDEFAQSRFRLEARYRHVLVDEFQDTSRAQWDLVAELVRSWGEGFGAGADALPPSIFIVGDRKQSIYGFRDADVLLLDEATRLVEGLRPDGDARRAISVSFRAVPELLAFVNDVFSAIEKSPDRADAFRYEEMGRFSVEIRPQPDLDLAPLGMIVGKTVGVTADRVANEVVRLLSHATVHDRATRLPRPVQPADVVLLTLLRETAYAYETRGPGRPQARENFKKLRGMVARFQNRGYATLARVADHLDQLAVGDESNAAIDAKDAVSLMTVHAAKGLEFPIVFVVNMGRGTTAARAPIRATCNSAGEPSVAIADYQSEADEDAQARDREETARLLYVALTRARDRLCLSATTQQGSCRMGRGSLGEVLPASLKVLFAEAAIGRTAVVGWPGSDGQMHRFIVPGRC